MLISGHSRLKAELVRPFMNLDLEAVCVKITSISKPICPGSRSEKYELLCDTVPSFLPKADLKWLVAGDWNMPKFSEPNFWEIPNSPKVTALSEFVAVSNFRQVNNILNHHHRTLDLVFTNCDDMDCKHCDPQGCLKMAIIQHSS